MDPDELLLLRRDLSGLSPEDLQRHVNLAMSGVIPWRNTTTARPGEPWSGVSEQGLVANLTTEIYDQDFDSPFDDGIRQGILPFTWPHPNVHIRHSPHHFRQLTSEGWSRSAPVPSPNSCYVMETLRDLISFFESGVALRDGSEQNGPAITDEASRLDLVLRDVEDLISAFENRTPFIHPRTYPHNTHLLPSHLRDSWVPSPIFLPYYKRIHAAMGGGIFCYFQLADLLMWGLPGIPWEILSYTFRSPLYDNSLDLTDPAWVTFHPLLVAEHLKFDALIPHFREIAHRPQAKVTLAEAVVLSTLTAQHGWTELYLEVFGGDWRLSKICSMVLTLEEKGWGNLSVPA